MDTTTGHPNGTRDRTKSVEDFRSRSRSRTPRVRSRSRTYTRSPNHSRSPSPPALPKSAKIVIEKLTKNVHEAHLREIFSTYGTITELEMPMNPQFMMNKGIAYILFTQPSHAESAIAHMHEAQLDGALVNVSIVLPRRRFSRSPPMKRPALDRFGEPHRLRQVGPPSGMGGMGRGGMGGPPMGSMRGGDRPYGGRGSRASPSYGAGRRSPGPRYEGRGGGGSGGGGYRDRYDDRERYRPRSPSRSPPPRGGRRRSPSYGSRSRSPKRASRSPAPRRREDSPPRGGGRRRSPSYDSYSSRSRSSSRDRRGGRR
ncbi:hypothetical protein LTR91_020302 [Friedmanniomyces endolithicus]|uniref:RRM domain-containing protein n=1 Tax=Friedmanniomyces endolithicus TaxID=329885 RepID=A0AAN6K0N1_9PEZI|nr:hypothetical protein LTS09_006912 [Friedmanniomyces endolithicus]KAK0288731.1 hypothetical protein LTR35_003129 [Friedmanniomyces endolithicus]KAK0300499.1 hypothetical protein LTS00_000754 [Friedmanniomyces endolithicus]KAK0328456.1 hypothetical protein LTR82_000387 [Friedmanniomyces endolithicus]KAK0925346.1 hypothetical protein LTR57_004997 [Friedmanniomyces endolithicus]